MYQCLDSKYSRSAIFRGSVGSSSDTRHHIPSSPAYSIASSAASTASRSRSGRASRKVVNEQQARDVLKLGDVKPNEGLIMKEYDHHKRYLRQNDFNLKVF